jgi:hypothetical protein
MKTADELERTGKQPDLVGHGLIALWIVQRLNESPMTGSDRLATYDQMMRAVNESVRNGEDLTGAYFRLLRIAAP